MGHVTGFVQRHLHFKQILLKWVLTRGVRVLPDNACSIWASLFSTLHAPGSAWPPATEIGLVALSLPRVRPFKEEIQKHRFESEEGIIALVKQCFNKQPGYLLVRQWNACLSAQGDYFNDLYQNARNNQRIYFGRKSPILLEAIQK